MRRDYYIVIEYTVHQRFYVRDAQDEQTARQIATQHIQREQDASLDNEVALLDNAWIHSSKISTVEEEIVDE